MISVIYSTFNEQNNIFFHQSLKLLKECDIDVVCVDGGSSDRTQEIVRNYGYKFILGDKNSRGLRYNLGIGLTKSEMIVFHHPRSFLMLEGIKHLVKHHKKYDWGAFSHKFDVSHPVLNFTSWYSNNVRGDLKHIYYLDHCIFVSRVLLEKIGGFPGVEIFEDTELSLRLRSIRPAVRLPYVSTTSSVRFTKNGILKQAILNQKLKVSYLLKRDPHVMYKTYEKDMNLNTSFTKE